MNQGDGVDGPKMRKMDRELRPLGPKCKPEKNGPGTPSPRSKMQAEKNGPGTPSPWSILYYRMDFRLRNTGERKSVLADMNLCLTLYVQRETVFA